ncbi:MAG: signal peptidase II [Firmicutes bacterium]|nr:signal peptidase II [Bacillota bacterium]
MNRKILIITVITLFLDQISKSFIDSLLKVGESIKIISNFFYITYLNNYGAAWSILSNKNALLIIFSLISLIIIYRFIYVFKRNNRNTFAFGFIIGGIVGNLIDRWLFGYVRDFIDIRIFNYDYPTFNIADVAVVIGIFLLVIAIIKGEDKNGNTSSKSK